MTTEQELFLNEVILPKLVKMAMDDTLSLNMTTLSADDFAKEAINFNKEHEEDNMVKRAMGYLAMEFDEAKRVLREIEADKSIDENDMLDDCHDDLEVLQAFETIFTVGDFFNQIR